MRMVDAPFVIGLRHLDRFDALHSPAGLSRWLAARVDEGLHWYDHALSDSRDHAPLLGRAIGLDRRLRHRLELVLRAGVIPALHDDSGLGIKHYDSRPAYLERALDDTLATLGLERVNTLILMRPDPLMDVEATGRALDNIVASGRALHTGVANFLPAQWRHLQSAMHTPLACQQMEMSIARSQMLFDGLWETLLQDGMQGLAGSPLWGGRIFENQVGETLTRIGQQRGASPAGVALAWLATIPGRPIPVVGSLRERRLRDLQQDADLRLTRPEWFALLEAARACRVA